ncbi:MAG: nicotinate phosphoribosyltransferase [Candidatus Vogelbacteria bacterium]|nr:nicotinate phosphoribosyltransferase [Candidatus Vogelbacteria bacterium]
MNTISWFFFRLWEFWQGVRFYEPGTIKSLLEVDLYKLTMLQSVWKRYRDTEITFAFKNRTKKVKLPRYINEDKLRSRLDHVMTLRFRFWEIEYLRSLGLFSGEFLSFLSTLRLANYKLVNTGDNFEISVAGKWVEVTLWETLLLSIVNEMYYEGLMAERGISRAEAWVNGKRRLEAKVADIKYFGLGDIIEFGNRRAFSRRWQDYVVWYMLTYAPECLVGTSNVFLAMKYGLKPIGTFAHEMFMGVYGIHRAKGSKHPAHDSQREVLEVWWTDYGQKLSIALTDNYGSKFFFDNLSRMMAKDYRGLRHDSGDPFKFGEDAIRFYEKMLIDPKEKILVFSDGLDLNTIRELTRCFKGRIGLTFGWGTNLTNDMGFEALSMVAKLVRSSGFGTVKLSDNLAKATGEPEDIESVVAEVGYNNTDTQECRY